MGITYAALTCDGLEGEARVELARGREEMNALPHWELRLIAPMGTEIDADKMLGGAATLQIIDEEDEGALRSIALVVTSFEEESDVDRAQAFRLELAPAAALLGYRKGFRVFQQKTTRQIVTELLEGGGVASDHQAWRTTGKYQKRNYCVQYRESEWDFVERLLADEGIAYHFDAKDDGTPQIVFSDHAEAYVPIPGPGAVLLNTGDRVVGRCLRAFSWIDRLTEDGVHLRDFDVRTPDVLIEGKAGEEGGREYLEYPAFVLDADAAKARAAARLEQLRRDQAVVFTLGTSTRLAPGRLVHVEGANDPKLNRDYLVVGVTHELKRLTERHGDPYVCNAKLVPWGEMAYRPAPPSRRPRVSGVEMAITTGPAGEEIHVDDLGRLKVRFPWDPSGVQDDTSSYWVRCMQMNMHSSMLLPRVGWEVPVMYRDGNPDEPIVVGRLYNGAQVTPYALPGAAASTSLQSATSPGGGTTNEIRMIDTAGAMEMFVHASKDQTVTVGGSAKTTVSVNQTHDVTLALVATVDASQTTTVGAKQSVDVGTDYGITVKGSRTEMIGGLEAQRVVANRVVSIKGAYTELIGAFHGIQSNKTTTSVKGAYTHLIGGTHDLKGGSGFSETVVAARTEVIGATKTITSKGAVSDTVTGIKSVTAGNVKEKAGTKVSTASKAAGKISVGGSAKITSSAAIEVEAKTITIEAPTLKAEAMKLSGGAVKISKGNAKVAGEIKRQGGQKTKG